MRVNQRTTSRASIGRAPVRADSIPVDVWQDPMAPGVNVRIWAPKLLELMIAFQFEQGVGREPIDHYVRRACRDVLIRSALRIRTRSEVREEGDEECLFGNTFRRRDGRPRIARVKCEDVGRHVSRPPLPSASCPPTR